AFASRLSDSLGDDRVSAYVADEITNAVLREKPDLIAVRPMLLATARGVVASDAFRSVVRVTARQAHAAALSKSGRNLLLSVPDVSVVLRGALANASPSLVSRIPPRISTAIASVGDSHAGRVIVDMWQLGRKLAWAAGIGMGVGLALLISGIAFAPRRARALRRASIDLALIGVILLLLIPAVRVLLSALPASPLAQQAAAGVFDVFTLGLRRLALGLGGVGLIFSAAAHSLLEKAWLPETARSAWTWLRRPVTTWQHVARGALFLIAGACFIVRPAPALDVLAIVAGAVLAFAGLQALFRLLLRAPATEMAVPEDRFGPRRALALLAVAGALGAVVVLATRPHEAAFVRVEGCNGDARLCDRPLDQVVFAGTHNAMSAADRAGWMFAQQERDLAAQLHDGVRAFLIDVYAGVPVSGRIKTEIGKPGFMREVEKAIGKEGVVAAERTRARLVGPPEGPRGLYLCHGFCEIGAQPLVPWLRTMREFLVAHPEEVVILVIEDYVTPEELAAAFTASGLVDLVYRGAPRPPWPTLGQMAASNQRVVTFIESGEPGVDWLFPAFASIQETPYRFRQISQLSCGVNRGGTAGSLFQINHWIETPPTPRPSNAAIVNAYHFLLRRADECARERSHLPNVIAVDFYRTGDLLSVVRHLNGLDN
ncbi:MAG TPA: hypothetical protein VN903_25150, partial [Polyangia bacterium]|nr:hypothetical protein [Polyangia bacterium]